MASSSAGPSDGFTFARHLRGSIAIAHPMDKTLPVPAHSYSYWGRVAKNRRKANRQGRPARGDIPASRPDAAPNRSAYEQIGFNILRKLGRAWTSPMLPKDHQTARDVAAR